MLLVYLDKILGINSYGIIPIAKIEGFTLNILKNGKLSLENLNINMNFQS